MKPEKHLTYFLTAMFAFFTLTLLTLSIGCGGSSYSSGGGAPPPPANAKEWTWMGGSSTVPATNKGASGAYGTLGTAAASNMPGGRDSGVTWTDHSGNLWLFGGQGIDSAGTLGLLNDLWKFSPATKEWTWVSGSSTVGATGQGQPGVYGTLGVSAVTNTPGARGNAVSWIDDSGNLWLFGGYGYDSIGTLGHLNDLWEFNPATKEWTWVSGSSTVGATGQGEPGVYGTLGKASTSNVPGGRAGSVSWSDSSGNLWLFGGGGFDSAGTSGYLNDLWEFNPATKEWTWVSGSSGVGPIRGVGQTYTGATGIYGTLGTPATSNVPGGRYVGSVGWIDGNDNLWLFGGAGVDSKGTYGQLNDLWKFAPTTKEWTWMSGANTASVTGIYGTQGMPSTANAPGSRRGAVGWIVGSNNLWLSGGYGVDSLGMYEQLNDLWEFSPTAQTWTWVSGADMLPATGGGQSGVYGTLGTPAATNVPGGRLAAVSWKDSSGNFWLFGGDGYDAAGTEGELNDLWRYGP